MSSIENALLSLDGLSVGDALGASFGEGATSDFMASQITDHELPPAPWQWTDDTHMALSIVEVLSTYGDIHQDALAELFAERFSDEPYRGYAQGAAWLLSKINEGEDWRELSRELFEGGSYGNGAAMRAAPIGGYFSGQPERAADEARKSAVITHAHPEGQAGAIAVAVAASIAGELNVSLGRQFLEIVLEHTPVSELRDGVEVALQIPPDQHRRAVDELGVGWDVSAQDTVPFCLWCAAHQLGSFEEALWQALAGGGDRDTTCAIVGGIVALSARAIPTQWLARREPLPDDIL